MVGHIVDGKELFLSDPVIKDCLKKNPRAMLSLARAFLKSDAKHVEIISGELGGTFVGGKVVRPDLVVRIDGCMIASIDVQIKYHDDLIMRGASYTEFLHNSTFLKGFDWTIPQTRTRTFFILKNGILVPEDKSPLVTVANYHVHGYGSLMDTQFLCLEKLKEGAGLLPCLQRKWSFIFERRASVRKNQGSRNP